MAKAKAKAAKKSKSKEVVDTANTASAEILSLEAEIIAIKKSEIMPRRKRIAELRRSQVVVQKECSHENVQRIQGSDLVQCQNAECGKLFRLQE